MKQHIHDVYKSFGLLRYDLIIIQIVDSISTSIKMNTEQYIVHLFTKTFGYRTINIKWTLKKRQIIT